MAAASHHSPGFQMPTMTSPSMRFMVKLLMALFLVSMTGAALAGKKSSDLDRNQYSFSAAIRWADFEGAWTMVDPEVRKAKPMTEVDFSRFEQIQVTSYRDLAVMPGPDGTELREIQIELINRNTLRQRRVRFTEVWRYDAEAKTWWIAALPDFWQGK
jgi:hypothetical protein